MSRFAGLNGAKRGFSSNALTEGEYVIRIDKCDFFPTEMYGDTWKNTLTVLGVVRGSHAVGEEVNTSFRARNKSFASNLCGFLAGVTGSSDEDITDASGEEALAENSPINGLVCVVKARKRTHKSATNEDGSPVTYHVYEWERAMSPDQIKDMLPDEVIAKYFPNGL